MLFAGLDVHKKEIEAVVVDEAVEAQTVVDVPT